MPNIDKHAPGSFCWIELATTDSPSAKKFYTELFGWTPDDNPMGPGMTYTIWKLQGRDAGAMYEQMADQKQQGIPPHWLIYMATDNVDSTVAQGKALGFNVLAGPFDVMDKGRMAVVADPQGATFGLWQSMSHTGTGIQGVPGSFCWAELAASDVAAARESYEKLFGWTFKVSPEYSEILLGGNSIGGFMANNPEWGAPPHWGGYFMVTSCDDSTAKAKSLGGKVLLEPMDIPNTGRFSVISDPQGATFMLFQPQMG